MEDPRKPIGRLPIGIWFGLAVLGLLMVAWAMQAYSLLNWESAVALGIQNERLTGDAAERAWALESWGVAAADHRRRDHRDHAETILRVRRGNDGIFHRRLLPPLLRVPEVVDLSRDCDYGAGSVLGTVTVGDPELVDEPG